MKARVPAILQGVLLAAAWTSVPAQTANKHARVATLWTTTRALAQPYIEEDEGGLKELYWPAGKT
ncbi:MAG: hypothetical protein EFKGCFLK_01382 [Rhodocyclaceae bacterium]|nr:MAG: hypothetical protein F9K21_05630 [Rhodocyclaceae bacterium]MBV6407814.1 hypothetical protein [Rhodocyclaceae bacterium]MBZ0230341.1 hypothetical protein [Bauldia sp.]CAG0941299.1 hypothetical protein GPROT2_01253 [Gammaproteobacteria bacterium]